MPLPPELLNPALMAIGDSLFNGCRSMTVTDDLSKLSLPGFVAREGFGLSISQYREGRYQAPDPELVLIDFEAAFRHIIDIGVIGDTAQLVVLAPELFRRARENALAWSHAFSQPGPRPDVADIAFDNLAIAGAIAQNMFEDTDATVQQRLDAMFPSVERHSDVFDWKGTLPAGCGWDADGAIPAPAPIKWTAGDLHVDINLRHKLNPANHPSLTGVSAIEQVRLRKPKILLVNLGANHGLIDITLQGKAQLGLSRLNEFVDRLWAGRNYAATLAGVAQDADIEKVCIDLIPRPSQVFNMMPPYIDYPGVDAPKPHNPPYFDTYVPALAFPPSNSLRYSKSDMITIDQEVEKVRDRLRATTVDAFKAKGIENRLVVADFAAYFEKYDSKAGNAQPVLGKYTSYAIGRTSGGQLRGGLGGLDNHHPTMVGYRLLAKEIAAALNAPHPVAVTDSDDTLLMNMPHAALSLLDTFYRFRLGPVPASAGPNQPLGEDVLAQLAIASPLAARGERSGSG